MGALEHAAALAAAAARSGVTIEYFLDLNVGMGRTGIHVAAALALFDSIGRLPDSAARLRFAGLHAYAGQNHGATAEERSREAERSMALATSLAGELARRGTPVPRIVVAGTPAFLAELEVLRRLLPGQGPGGTANSDPEIEVSPGTWIYWDSASERLLPGLFTPACLLFARVIDRPGSDRITIDMGHKRWAIDAGPLEIFGIPGLEVAAISEEHTVLRVRARRGTCASAIRSSRSPATSAPP